MVNDFEVIHMGGRTYNPILGRFMQADPFVQAPANLQNYNRYSYVLNNPMSYTDPSGYFFKKLMKATGVIATMKFLASNALLNGIVMVGLNFIPFCQGWCSALFSAVQSYAVTGSLGGALRAGAFAYTGGMVGGLGNLGSAAGVLASGIAGGILSTQKSLNEIFATEKGQEVFQKLSSESPLRILLNNIGENFGTLGGNLMTVYLNTKLSFYNLATEPFSLTQFSVTRIIAHEMGHAVMGISDDNNENVSFTDKIMKSIDGTVRQQYSNSCRINPQGVCR